MNIIPIKFNGSINITTFNEYCDYLVNQIYKLLPLKEQEFDWVSYLDSLIEEIIGANEMFLNNCSYISIANQLEGLRYIDIQDNLTNIEKQKLYRKTVLGNINRVKKLSMRGE